MEGTLSGRSGGGWVGKRKMAGSARDQRTESDGKIKVPGMKNTNTAGDPGVREPRCVRLLHAGNLDERELSGGPRVNLVGARRQVQGQRIGIWVCRAGAAGGYEKKTAGGRGL